MGGWGYTEDGRQGQERVQSAATPVLELDDGPGQVQVQDEGGDNNRESSSSVQVVIIGYECSSYILLYPFRRTKPTGQTNFFFF
jgi:hypothetical protein